MQKKWVTDKESHDFACFPWHYVIARQPVITYSIGRKMYGGPLKAGGVPYDLFARLICRQRLFNNVGRNDCLLFTRVLVKLHTCSWRSLHVKLDNFTRVIDGVHTCAFSRTRQVGLLCRWFMPECASVFVVQSSCFGVKNASSRHEKSPCRNLQGDLAFMRFLF